MANETIEQRQCTGWEKIFVNDTSDKGISKISKELNLVARK